MPRSSRGDRRSSHGGACTEPASPRITPALSEATERWPTVLVGSYPSFDAAGPEVEVVLKSSDPDLLEAARAWLESELDRLT